jgi:hypothetical protein
MEPITTLAQLDALDGDVIVEGYRAGFHNTPNYTRREQAYWHGYLNGQVDGGFMQLSVEQQQLAHAVFERGDFHAIFANRS